MMQLLIPLGLLALLSIIVLIIIYIIKPNYQQKFISSTFVWKLSEKYRKKRIPVSKLRNLLLVLCQILILAACAFIISKPVIRADEPEPCNEKIIVIDASASMRAIDGKYKTRFERAVNKAIEKVNEAFEFSDGKVSIIVAGLDAEILNCAYVDDNGIENIPVVQLGSQYKEFIIEALNELVNLDENTGIATIPGCTYGIGDIEGAMALCEPILARMPQTEVILYTGTEYTHHGNVKVQVIREEVSSGEISKESNVGILNGKDELNSEFLHIFSVDIGYYGNANAVVDVVFTVYGGEEPVIKFAPRRVNLGADGDVIKVTSEPESIVNGEETWSQLQARRVREGASFADFELISYYDYATVEIKSIDGEAYSDAYNYDNEFHFFGGKKPDVKVEYVSTLTEDFTKAVVEGWRLYAENYWNVVFNIVGFGDYQTVKERQEGYDIYIFEHWVPNDKLLLPKDGIVIIIDPQTDLPDNLVKMGLSYADSRTKYVTSKHPNPYVWSKNGEISHPLLAHFAAPLAGGRAKTERLCLFDVDESQGWQVLATCNATALNQTKDWPVMLMKDDDVSKIWESDYAAKIFVIGTDLNKSTLPGILDFYLMLRDLFEVFYPHTIEGHYYEIGESATLNSISDNLDVALPNNTTKAYKKEDLPAKLNFEVPGVYTLSQRKISKQSIDTKVFVKIPAIESDITRTELTLITPFIETEVENANINLLIYLAAALVALLFVEWWLQSRDQF